jgi:hypothetical protein
MYVVYEIRIADIQVFNNPQKVVAIIFANSSSIAFHSSPMQIPTI